MLRITREQIGGVLGLSRRTAYRGLQVLLSADLIESRYGVIHIEDGPDLYAFIVLK